MKNSYLVRDIEAGVLMENFLVAGISSILFIRLYLHLTNYPQIAFGDFHIAHVLFGGFLMMASLGLLFVFLNRHIKVLAAIIGGVGFGTFIDELGKFITKDNDYWFQPTIALIYIIFVLLFLALRAFERHVRFNSTEYTVNAIEMTKEAILHDMDIDEKKKALRYLKESNPNEKLVVFLTALIEDMDVIPIKNKNLFSLVKTFFHTYYLKITRMRIFMKGIVIFFTISTLVSIGQAIYYINENDTFLEWGELSASALSGIFVVLGVYYIRRKRRRTSFEFFRLSVLVSILLKQFFIFYREQLSAVIGLGFNIVILGVLQYLISEATIHTKRKKKTKVLR